MELYEIILENKEQLLNEIRSNVLDFFERESRNTGFYFILDEKKFTEFVIFSLKEFILSNFNLPSHIIHDNLDEELLRTITGNYFFRMENYYESKN